MVLSLERSFSPEELQEAGQIITDVKNYINHSGARIVENCYAIDGPSTRDKDDAIHIDASSRDKVVISVYISDVASFLKKDGVLDRKALQNIATLYGAKKNAPMLPDDISSEIFSLHENKLTPALEIRITMATSSGVILAIETDRVLVNPKNLTYEQAAEKISRSHMFQKWANVAGWLGRLRAASMQLPFYNYDTGILTDEEGIERYMSRSNYRAYSIVQETMILANHTLGLMLDHNFKFGIFRTQTNDRGSASSYSEICAHHASLKLDAYTHCTSPLRRYADIIAHRLVSYLGFPFRMSYEDITQKPNAFRGVHHKRGVMPYLSAELKHICSHLSEGARFIRNFRKNVFSEKASLWIEAVFPHTKAEELKKFHPGDFSHLLKEALNHNLSSDVFIAEIRARLNGEGGGDGKTSLNFPRDHVNLLRIQDADAAHRSLQQEIIRQLCGDKERIETVFGLLCQKEGIIPVTNNGSVAFRNSGKEKHISFAAIIFERNGLEYSCGEFSFSVKENMALARAKLEFIKAWVDSSFVINKQLGIPSEINVDERFKIENAWLRVKRTCNRRNYIIEEKRIRLPKPKKFAETVYGTDEDKKLYEYEMVIRKNNETREVIFRGRSSNGDKDEVQRNVRRRAINALIDRGDAEINPSAITADSTFTSSPEMLSDGFTIPREKIIIMTSKQFAVQR